MKLFRKVNLMRKKDSFQNYDKPDGTKVDLLQLYGVRTQWVVLSP
jgi:hypothetical protein